MAESSIFWTTGGAGDGASTYTQTQLNAWLRRTFLNSLTTEGVLLGYANALAVSGTASPLAIATGAAYVYGFPYENDTSTTKTVTTPAVGTTGGHVVLRVDWAAQTVRIVAVRNTDGVAAIPALTQTAGTTWEIRLASFTITTGGVITVTDARTYCHFNTAVSSAMIDALAIVTADIADNAITTAKIAALQVTAAKIALDTIDDTLVGNKVPALIARRGGSATVWSTTGTTNYTPTTVRMQCGACASSGGGTVTVTFPVAFSQPPVVVATVQAGFERTLVIDTITATTVSFVVRDAAGAGQIASIMWLATGPE